MQWLAQYLAEKTLARRDALDLLAVCVPSWQPVMPSDIGGHLPEWRGMGGPCAAHSW